MTCQAPDGLASSGRLPHPKAPSPRPRRADTPRNSTFVSLVLEKGTWDVVVPDSTPDSEVNTLKITVCTAQYGGVVYMRFSAVRYVSACSNNNLCRSAGLLFFHAESPHVQQPIAATIWLPIDVGSNPEDIFSTGASWTDFPAPSIVSARCLRSVPHNATYPWAQKY